MNEFTIGILGVFALVVMVFLGVRVFIAAAAVGLAGLVAMIGWDSGAGMVGTIPHSKSVTYTLSVLPMFILIGFLAFHAGITEKLFDAATKWLGWVPGGLAVATVLAATGFAAVSGASTATAAVFSETLSAPARRTSRMSRTVRTPPPTVSGMNARRAVRSTTSRSVRRPSGAAVMSRKTISSAPSSA